MGQLDRYARAISESKEYGSLPCYKVYLAPEGFIPEKMSGIGSP